MADPKSTQGFVHCLLEPLLAEVYCLVGDSERVMRLVYCEAAEELALAFSQIRSEMGYHSRYTAVSGQEASDRGHLPRY